MNYNGCDCKKVAIERIEGYRAAAAIFPVVRRVLSEFSGKVYNVKVDRALKEAVGDAGSIYSRMEQRYISIEFCGTDCHQWHTVAYLSRDKALPDGKRLDAAAMIESARKQYADNLARAYEIEDAGTRAEALKNQIEALYKAAEAVVDSVSYEAQDIYGIRRLRFC